MHSLKPQYDIIIIGAGHAGCEAAHAASKMGCSVLLATMSIEAIARMSCNPAIGGMGKGHIVREIDALGGIMAKIIDKAGIQFRMLNTKKGPAVRAPRAQADKYLYQQYMRQALESLPDLEIKQLEAVDILIKNQLAIGVITSTNKTYLAKAIIISCGTFLNGLIHVGQDSFPAGRTGESASRLLAQSIVNAGVAIGRLKTGTSPRIDCQSIDYSKLTKQQGDNSPQPFSFETEQITQPQVACYIGYTNKETHKIIADNLSLSPLYSGKIKGTGVRYCPSLEDKVVKFAEKARHQIFLEPEGYQTNEVYLNGLSTSMPADIQERFLRTIEGLENARIIRHGYAIEYDYYPPTQLKPTLETKLIGSLFFAGQINGTTGYEEAAGQGLLAGINAALKIKNKPPFILRRDQAYLGVLIDDLVTKGTKEPYRMFTARAEHRLVLRQDNADLRLTQLGYDLGLTDQKRLETMQAKKALIAQTISGLRQMRSGSNSLYNILKRPETRYVDLLKIDHNVKNLAKDVAEQVEIEIKYKGYIERETRRIRQLEKLEDRKIPEGIDYKNINGLKKEAREKLQQVKPVSLGQAGRISGISPCDLSVLLVHMEQYLRRTRLKVTSRVPHVTGFRL